MLPFLLFCAASAAAEAAAKFDQKVDKSLLQDDRLWPQSFLRAEFLFPPVRDELDSKEVETTHIEPLGKPKIAVIRFPSRRPIRFRRATMEPKELSGEIEAFLRGGSKMKPTRALKDLNDDALWREIERKAMEDIASSKPTASSAAQMAAFEADDAAGKELAAIAESIDSPPTVIGKKVPLASSNFNDQRLVGTAAPSTLSQESITPTAIAQAGMGTHPSFTVPQVPTVSLPATVSDFDAGVHPDFPDAPPRARGLHNDQPLYLGEASSSLSTPSPIEVHPVIESGTEAETPQPAYIASYGTKDADLVVALLEELTTTTTVAPQYASTTDYPRWTPTIPSTVERTQYEKAPHPLQPASDYARPVQPYVEQPQNPTARYATSFKDQYSSGQTSSYPNQPPPYYPQSSSYSAPQSSYSIPQYPGPSYSSQPSPYSAPQSSYSQPQYPDPSSSNQYSPTNGQSSPYSPQSSPYSNQLNTGSSPYNPAGSSTVGFVSRPVYAPFHSPYITSIGTTIVDPNINYPEYQGRLYLGRPQTVFYSRPRSLDREPLIVGRSQHFGLGPQSLFKLDPRTPAANWYGQSLSSYVPGAARNQPWYPFDSQADGTVDTVVRDYGNQQFVQPALSIAEQERKRAARGWSMCFLSPCACQTSKAQHTCQFRPTLCTK